MLLAEFRLITTFEEYKLFVGENNKKEIYQIFCGIFTSAESFSVKVSMVFYGLKENGILPPLTLMFFNFKKIMEYRNI